MKTKCIEWRGAKDRKGYGMFFYKNKIEKAHRISYRLFNGSLGLWQIIDHLCRNHSCINPEHLEAVTAVENVLRGNSPAAINSRKRYCIRKHTYTKENTIRKISPNGRPRRECRKCRVIKNRRNNKLRIR